MGAASLHKGLLYGAYGYLLVAGILHYYLDVFLQYRSGQRAPGNETNLYYGLHTAYSLGQIVFAVLALIVVSHGSDIMSRWPGQVLSVIAVLGWLTISVFFAPYVPPRINMGIVGVLLIAAAITA